MLPTAYYIVGRIPRPLSELVILNHRRPWSDRWKPLVNIGGHGEVGVLDRAQNVMYWHLKVPFHTAFDRYGWATEIPRRADAAGLEPAWLRRAVSESSRVRLFVGDENSVLEANDPDVWIGFVERTGSVYSGKTLNGKVLPSLYEFPLLVPEFFKEITPDETTMEAFVVLQRIKDRHEKGLPI